jgi:putative oxidoreductase
VNARLHAALALGARLALAGLFFYAGMSKLYAPAEFARDIANYHVLSDALSGWAAVLLPVCELVIALGLLLPSHARGAALLSAVLLFGFAAAMGQAKLRGIDLACGCFGGEARVSWTKVSLDIALAALAVWLVTSTRPHGGPSQVPSGGSVA